MFQYGEFLVFRVMFWFFSYICVAQDDSDEVDEELEARLYGQVHYAEDNLQVNTQRMNVAGFIPPRLRRKKRCWSSHKCDSYGKQPQAPRDNWVPPEFREAFLKTINKEPTMYIPLSDNYTGKVWSLMVAFVILCSYYFARLIV